MQVIFKRNMLAMSMLVALGSASAAADIDSESHWEPRWQEMASVGTGFVVWESNRSGRWRLWHRNLDGSDKRQLSPEEDNRDHFGPHVSPDGTRVVYISYPHTRNPYKPMQGNETAQLRIIDVDGGSDRELVASARAYFENRSAVWINDQELIYIDGEGYTCRLDLATGDSERITRDARKEYGWLIDPTLTYATDGRPRFSPYDASEQTIAARSNMGGCQPYFTQDGKWGFWTGGMGGPIRRVHLESGEVSAILERNDHRMPSARSYLYFPMISPCQRLFAVAASPDQHDHHRSDYAIFVFRMDPETLEVVGEPARYSFDGGTDRYPSVFLADAALGTHRGKAPLSLSLDAEEAGDWRWDFGDDGEQRRGQRIEHTFTEPGSYVVTARRGDAVLRGTVTVDEPAPPRVRRPVIADGRQLRLIFNEPIDVSDLQLRMASDNGIDTWELSDDAQRLTVRLADELTEADHLHIEGVTDLAQRPNRMPAERLAVVPTTWPTDPGGLVFMWQTGDKPNLVADAAGDHERTYSLEGRGLAKLNHHHAMVLRDGAFVVESAVNERLQAEAQASDQLTIEATITPAHVNQTGPARIVSFSTDTTNRNFTLGQEGSSLVLRLRTPQGGSNANRPQVSLCTLKIGEPNHIIVTYKPGRMVCYRNGEKVLDTDAVKGGFDPWTSHHLLLGAEYRGGRTWQGELEGVAIYSRFMGADEAGSNAHHYLAQVSARPATPRLEVEAELLAVSGMPTLDQISPYRQALVTYEYRLLASAEAGDVQLAEGDTIRVMHWAILNGETLPIGKRSAGERHRLQLEPFGHNGQLDAIYQSDTLPDDFDAALFYGPLH
ncbi:MAG: LamG-like jellyroll fold domain-containing protein [Phycisphaeraceae bacterium]